MSKFSRTPGKTYRARELRQRMTTAEQRLWRVLRSRQLGESFRRQHPIGPYFADFYCARLKFVIELDGGQHHERRRNDARRECYMNSLGIVTVRFWNNEVIENLDGVCAEIGWVILRRRFEFGLSD